MTIIQVSFIASVLLYSLLYDCRLLCIFITILGVYQAISFFYYPGGFGSSRRRLAQALWTPPQEGVIHNNVEIDLTNTMKYLHTQKAKDNHVTLTHVVIKAMAECLKATKSKICGKIVFGKFVEYPTVDISCLVSIGEGEDLASLLVTKADEKTFEDIADFINAKAKLVKAGKDSEHKQRTGPMKYLPPFVIGIILELTQFLTYNLGITIKPLGLKKDSFGACTVTSIGALGFKNATAPFTPMMRSVFIVTINQVFDKPVVKDGQIVIAPTVNLNFCTDHRFMDGGSIVKSNKAVFEVFEHPEKYERK